MLQSKIRISIEFKIIQHSGLIAESDEYITPGLWLGKPVIFLNDKNVSDPTMAPGEARLIVEFLLKLVYKHYMLDTLGNHKSPIDFTMLCTKRKNEKPWPRVWLNHKVMDESTKTFFGLENLYSLNEYLISQFQETN